MSRAVYILELEPELDESAMWYVGITNDVERRVHEHYSENGVNWTKRNRVVDYHTVGEWTTADVIENQLTLVLLYEFGRETTRGGKYMTDVGIDPNFHLTDVYPELLEALRELSDDRLASIGQNYLEQQLERPAEPTESSADDREILREDLPIMLRRASVKEDRDDVHQLFVYEDTAKIEKEARRELEDRFENDVYKLDLREAIYRAGMENLDDAEAILREWGADI